MLPVVDAVLLRFVVFAHICIVLQLLAQKALFHILIEILLTVRRLVQFRISVNKVIIASGAVQHAPPLDRVQHHFADVVSYS